MDSANYIALTRQTGLLKELQITANNIANASTTGYRAEGVVFAEVIKAGNSEGGSVSMTDARVRYTSEIDGGVSQTSGKFDVAIQGAGFFQVETPNGVRLTRNGAFTPDAQNELVTFDGYRVLDSGGAPIFIPPDQPDIAISSDGTISSSEGPISQIGVVAPADPSELVREDGVFFNSPNGAEQIENPFVLQGHIEGSNVDPVWQIARLIEVQRAYESSQKFLEKEDERIRSVVRTLGTAR